MKKKGLAYMTCVTNTWDMFYLERDHLSAIKVVERAIKTPHCIKPINIRLFLLSWTYQKEIEQQVTKMKRDGIVRNFTSPFNFPFVVVKKKDLTKEGTLKLRICGDFQKCN